jgi:hypothetical protein
MTINWKTTAIGFVVAFIQYFATVGASIPKTAEEWGHAALSAALFAWGAVQKDWNVSNSPQPAAATTVSAVNEAKPNPSAVTGG